MIDIVQDASSFEAFEVLSVRKGARFPSAGAGIMKRKKVYARDMLLNYIISDLSRKRRSKAKKLHFQRSGKKTFFEKTPP